MKKIILLFALLFGLTTFAQFNFPWKKPDILLGKEIKVKPIKTDALETGYSKFFSDELLQTHYLGDEFHSPVESLLGRTFKVAAVDPVAGETNIARLKLVDEAKGETIYYRYSKNVESFFNFEVIGGLTLPANYYCDYIVPAEGVPGEKHIRTTEVGGIEFKKSITKSPKPETTYLAQIMMQTKQFIDTDGTEITIVLNDGKQLHTIAGAIGGKPYPDKHGFYNQFAVFFLSKADVALLKTNLITDVKVMNSKRSISANDSAILNNLINCLINKQIKE